MMAAAAAEAGGITKGRRKERGNESALSPPRAVPSSLSLSSLHILIINEYSATAAVCVRGVMLNYGRAPKPTGKRDGSLARPLVSAAVRRRRRRRKEGVEL